MSGRIIIKREDAVKLAATGHAASADRARPALCQTYLEWRKREDGQAVVDAKATDSYCAVIRTVEAELAEGTPDAGAFCVDAKELIAAVKATERFLNIVILDEDEHTVTVGNRILAKFEEGGNPVQARIEGVVYADASWSPKRYGMLPALSTTIFAKVAKAWDNPNGPLRMWCLPDMPGDAWLKPVMFTGCSAARDFRAWQMPVRI